MLLAVLAISDISSGQTSGEPTDLANFPAVNSDVSKTTTKDKIKRWFEFDQLTIATRYHFIENENNGKAANNDQYQFVAKFKFKFDRQAKYNLVGNFSTGSTFTTSWNATGWGTGKSQKNFNLRQLYFDAKPDKAVEIQIGGLYENYGESSEAISYDNDSYLTGERLQIRLPKRLYFDEVSLTLARVADINVPDVFRRFRHFGKQNYHQFLVRKQFGKSVGFSADYTAESGVDTFHQAWKFKLPAKSFIDTFLFEQYERVDPDRNYGFNAYGEKKLTKIFTIGSGLADIRIKALNGDRFVPGKRAYLNGVAKLNREFTVTALFTQGVGTIAPNVARTRLDFILTYNILESLKRTRYF